MKAQSRDTHPDAERVQIKLLRGTTIAQCARLTFDLSRTVIQLARRAIRRANPGASEAEVGLIFIAVHYGKDLAVHLSIPVREVSVAMPSLPDALLPVVEALEKLGVAYHIGGSIASSAYGIARSTIDVDIVADLSSRYVAEFVASLQDAYYVDAAMVRDAIAQRASFNVIHQPTMLKIDVFIPKEERFDRLAFERMREDTLGEEDGRLFYLLSPEDVILRKLEWYKAGGEVSERQWNDALGVLKVQGSGLDFTYMRQWAGELGVADLLERLVEQASD